MTMPATTKKEIWLDTDPGFDDWFAWALLEADPAVRLHGVGTQVTDCDISDGPHMGLAFDGNDHVIARNRFARVARDFSDMGAIYINLGEQPLMVGAGLLGPDPGGEGISNWHMPEACATYDWCFLAHPDDLYTNVPRGQVGQICRDAYGMVVNTEVADPIATAMRVPGSPWPCPCGPRRGCPTRRTR